MTADANRRYAAYWDKRVTVPLAGEHFRRRPLVHLRELGFVIEESERFTLGAVERVCARKPVSGPAA